ncbi:MAG: cytidylate kinase-like family protein [Treponema sp.]|jgi:cytidylate kinase|nr:cytidylate kinase-like family protein [Treponema sp.]
MKRIITISREFGSGGRTIGRLTAQELGYDFYDNELIDLSAKESGLSPEFIERTEQNISSGWLYNMMLGSSYATGTTGAPIGSGNPILPLADQVFNAQRKTILQIAKKGPCVIVGRCADYILKSDEDIATSDILNVFIFADMSAKMERAVKKYGIPADDAKKTINRINKRRANHYNTFTEDTWGNRSNYDVMLNSTLLGVEKTAELLVEIVKKT